MSPESVSPHPGLPPQSYGQAAIRWTSKLTVMSLPPWPCRDAAAALSKESGYTLESPTITTFRNGVLDGNWETVTRLLRDEHIIEGDVLGVGDPLSP